MPYIVGKTRVEIDYYLDEFIKYMESTELSNGDLNYTITRLLQEFLRTQTQGPKYADYNNVIGTLECAKLELYRRQIAEYEDIKIKENGDVYNNSLITGSPNMHKLSSSLARIRKALDDLRNSGDDRN